MRSLGVALLILCAVVSSSSQQHPARVAVRCAPVTHQADSLQRAVSEAARGNLQSLGIGVTDSLTDYVLYTDAVTARGQVTLSLWLCHALPAEAVSVCARAEIFYAGISPEKRAGFPAEGKWVREKLTADYVREFVLPLESRMQIIPADRVRETIAQEMHVLADTFLKTHPAHETHSDEPNRH